MFLFNKKNSLKNKKDIENLFKNGKSCSHKFLRTMYLPSESFLKIGVSVPKKLVPLAVKRNLTKRRIKEQIRQQPKNIMADVLFQKHVKYVYNVKFYNGSPRIMLFIGEAGKLI